MMLLRGNKVQAPSVHRFSHDRRSRLTRRTLRKVGKAAVTRAGSPRALVAAYLGTQVDELRANEPGARIGSPDAVHRMRVASRRLRSTLATFVPLFVGPASHQLRHELLWLGAVLGPVRDVEVMRDHLHGT